MISSYYEKHTTEKKMFHKSNLTFSVKAPVQVRPPKMSFIIIT